MNNVKRYIELLGELSNESNHANLKEILEIMVDKIDRLEDEMRTLKREVRTGLQEDSR